MCGESSDSLMSIRLVTGVVLFVVLLVVGVVVTAIAFFLDTEAIITPITAIAMRMIRIFRISRISRVLLILLCQVSFFPHFVT